MQSRARLLFLLRSSLALSLLVTALVVVSDSAPQRDVMAELRLARLMPKGALLYAQSRNLAEQFNLWRTSAAHDRYFASKSYEVFQTSRLYLKLQSRVKEFETALGVEFSEANIAALAGGRSAVSIYDLDKLELVIVSEMARAKAFASILFANAKNFDERTAPGGTVYYVREFAADGGRTQQRVAFAYLDGQLILASSEGLLQRTLANAGSRQTDDRLSDEIAVTVARATDFAAHDVTLWLNQAKLNANRYFNSYWLHKNRAHLAALQTGLIDLAITPTELRERRWFVLDPERRSAARGTNNAAISNPGQTHPLLAPSLVGVKGEQLANLLRFAPASAQFMEARVDAANNARLTDSVAATLFGQLPPPPASSGNLSPDYASDTSFDSDRPGRYRYLDTRFDRDIDDEAAVKLSGGASEREAAAQRFASALAPVLAAVKPAAYVVIETPQLDANKLFARFNRAVVIELGDVTGFSQSRLENAIAAELQARFIVGNVGQRLGWQVEGQVHSLSQSLLEQGGAYALSGSQLIIASNKEYCSAVLAQGAAQANYPATLSTGLLRYAVVRPLAAKPVFTKLTRVLDGKPPISNEADQSPTAARGAKTEETEESEASESESSESIAFFSENLASLLTVIDGVREATYEAAVSGDLLLEVVAYRLK